MTKPAGETSAPDELVYRMRSVLSNPNRVMTFYWAASIIGVVAVLPLQVWPPSALRTLLIVGGVFVLAFFVRLIGGTRLPPWTVHVDVLLATILISVLSIVGITQHVPFAVLYVWVAIFAAMYLRPRAVFLYVVLAAFTYVVVLLRIGSNDPLAIRHAPASWLVVIGTTTIAAVTISGLVSALRVDARQDPVTGIANRRYFDERLEEEVQRARRAATPLSLAIIDVDEFKAINDRFGHDGGDRLLRQLCGAWTALMRNGGDFLARLGGDEFAVLAAASDATGITQFATRLEMALPMGVSCSVGVATWDGHETAGSLYRRADQAMYEVKELHRQHRQNDGRPDAGAAPR